MYRVVQYFFRKVLCIVSLIVLGVLSLSSWVQAADVDELNAKLNDLRKEVAELKTNRISNDNVATAGATRGSIKLPGTQTSISIGGYAKGVFMWSSISAGANAIGDKLASINSVPVGPTAGAHARSQINFNAAESQLWFMSSTPSKYGTVISHVEGDFFGTPGTETATNAHGFRLRKAYGSIGNLQIGHNITAAFSRIAFPEYMDSTTPIGMIYTRQVGVRWRKPFKNGSFTISVENPETSISNTAPPDTDKFPDVIGNVVYKFGNIAFEGAGIVRFLRIDQPVAVDSHTGWTAVLSGYVPMFGKDDLKFQISHGDGSSRYIGGAGTFGDAVLINNKLNNIKSTAGYIAYRHFWAERLRSSLILAEAKVDNPTNTPLTTINKGAAGYLNLVWSPVSKVDFGLEAQYLERSLENGQSGHVNRMLFTAKYYLF